VKLGNLAARVASAAVLAPIVVLACLWERHEGLWAVVFLATLAALHEIFAMLLADAADRWAGLAIGGALAALSFWTGPGLVVAFPLAVLLPGLYYLFRIGEQKTVAARFSATVLGVAYAGLLPTLLILEKRDLPRGGRWVLLTVMIAWLGDTAAYFAGRGIGGPKLYPAVSPGKTWAGAFGGLAGSVLAGVLANLWFLPELGWGHAVALCVGGGALGQCGDLVESLLKRSVGVKDSGKLLPGHGGMLDRIDALIFIAPVVYFYALLVWR
jgi:phosphatidate cytidylyltransferase